MEQIIQSFKRYLEGKYSRKDYLSVMEMVSDPSREKEFRQLLLDDWLEFNDTSLPDTELDHVLARVQHRIVSGEIMEKQKFRFLFFFQKVAAILFIPLLLIFMAYFVVVNFRTPSPGGMAVIECPEGVRTRFTLPDGTTGFLNGGSHLSYNLNFNSNRIVALTGEAFFDVKKDEKAPFRVNTSHLAVMVFGTAFSVIAYPDENFEEVVLQTGGVSVSRQDGTSLTNLTPDQKLKFDIREGAFAKREVVASQYTGWTEGKLIFRNEDMGQVALRLSRWYNASIEITDNRLLEFTFYATFLDEPLDEVLKLLALTTPISWKEEKRIPLEDGTFPKRKITLQLNQEKLKEFK